MASRADDTCRVSNVASVSPARTICRSWPARPQVVERIDEEVEAASLVHAADEEHERTGVETDRLQPRPLEGVQRDPPPCRAGSRAGRRGVGR